MLKPFDPLDLVPTPETARRLLAEAQARTSRLEILVEFSDRLHAPPGQLRERRDDGNGEVGRG